jgi:hypothetical protein
LLELLSKISHPHPVILEYPIFNERADVIFVGKDKALVIEAKGWKHVKKIGISVVEADRELHEDPCYQLNNYVNIVFFIIVATAFNFPQYKNRKTLRKAYIIVR